MKFSKIFEVNLFNMKSSLFQFASRIYDQLELRKTLMEKKNLKKFYVGHCRLQVTCTVDVSIQICKANNINVYYGIQCFLQSR